MIPYFGILVIVSQFLEGRQDDLLKYVLIITLGIVLKHILHGISTKISHRRVAYQTFGETRKKIFEKMSKLPMGYVKNNASDQIKTIIMDNIEQLENFFAHNIPEVISGLVIPVCMGIVVLILNPHVGAIMLIPVGLFFVSR